MKSRMVQLSTYWSFGKMMTMAVQLQMIFLNLHRAWFVWTGCPSMESRWSGFSRDVFTCFHAFHTNKGMQKQSYGKVSDLGRCFFLLASSGSWSNARGLWFLWQWLRWALKTPVSKLPSFPYVHGSSLISSLCSSFLLHFRSCKRYVSLHHPDQQASSWHLLYS